jgi:ketosteroid isomerase-like protein
MPTGLNFTIKDVIGEGDRIAVEAEGNATTSAGTAYRNQYVFLFTLDNGKIKQVDEYFCHVHANEVLWPLVGEEAKATG